MINTSVIYFRVKYKIVKILNLNDTELIANIFVRRNMNFGRNEV